MAKSKHQKLADLMQQMLDEIEEHFLKVTQDLNKVQLHFYEKQIVVGRPLMPQQV